MSDHRISIDLVNCELGDEKWDSIRISLDDLCIYGWGKTLQAAIDDFDHILSVYMECKEQKAQES